LKRARASIGRMHDYWAPVGIIDEAIAASVDDIVHGLAAMQGGTLPCVQTRNLSEHLNSSSFSFREWPPSVVDARLGSRRAHLGERENEYRFIGFVRGFRPERRLRADLCAGRHASVEAARGARRKARQSPARKDQSSAESSQGTQARAQACALAEAPEKALGGGRSLSPLLARAARA
jgi:hypothetical protein